MLICGLVGASFTQIGIAQAPAGFTAAQAERGSVVYRQTCAGCHGAELNGVNGPALSGATGNAGLIGNGAARASAEYMRPESASVLWVWQLP